MSGEATRPEDILADGDDYLDVDGTTLRKGTVAAFVRNAQRWSDPEIDPAARELLSEAIAAAVPALQALDLFAVFEIRDEELREFVANC